MAIHTTRDSLWGFDRSKLRRHIESHMGLKSNADMFASKGDTWQTTESEERRQAQIRAKLEQHLQESKANETQFKIYLKDKLADAGIAPSPTWDKQALARENKARRERKDTRDVHKTTLKGVRQRVARLANLEQELKNKSGSKSNKGKELSHFTIVTGPLTAKDREELGLNK